MDDAKMVLPLKQSRKGFGSCGNPELNKIMKTKEWHLYITEKGEIFVQHFTLPRFNMQIIIESGQPQPSISFQSQWKDNQQGGFDWYFKALEFYNSAARLPIDS